MLEEYAKIKSKPEKVVRSLLEKITERPFYNLSKLDFAKLLDDPNQLATNLNSYINGFSTNVREIMERFAFDQQIARMAEKNLLYEVIKAFAEVDLSPERVDNVQMGYVFEELIRIGAEQSNEEAGEHFTPREVIKLMVNLLLSPEKDLRRAMSSRPSTTRLAAPAGCSRCRRSTFVNSTPKPSRTFSARTGTTRRGRSASPTCSSRGGRRQHRPRRQLHEGRLRPRRRQSDFDYMLANPPFGVEWKQQQTYIEKEADTLGYDGRFGAGTAAHQRRRAACSCSTCFPRCAAEGRRQPHRHRLQRLAAIHRRRRQRRKQIRQWIIENDWLEAIVALPDQLFYNTGISTYVWVLTNRKEQQRRGKIQLGKV